MYTIKQLIARSVFFVELCALAIIYLYGSHGMHSIHQLQHETVLLEREVGRMAQEVATIEHDIAIWNHDDFCKEKVAREQLQMAYKDDEIYYIS